MGQIAERRRIDVRRCGFRVEADRRRFGEPQYRSAQGFAAIGLRDRSSKQSISARPKSGAQHRVLWR